MEIEKLVFLLFLKLLKTLKIERRKILFAIDFPIFFLVSPFLSPPHIKTFYIFSFLRWCFTEKVWLPGMWLYTEDKRSKLSDVTRTWLFTDDVIRTPTMLMTQAVPALRVCFIFSVACQVNKTLRININTYNTASIWTVNHSFMFVKQQLIFYRLISINIVNLLIGTKITNWPPNWVITYCNNDTQKKNLVC